MAIQVKCFPIWHLRTRAYEHVTARCSVGGTEDELDLLQSTLFLPRKHRGRRCKLLRLVCEQKWAIPQDRKFSHAPVKGLGRASFFAG